MKKKRKANSNMKRLTLVSKYVMKGLAIAFTLEQKATFVKISNGESILASQDRLRLQPRFSISGKCILPSCSKIR